MHLEFKNVHCKLMSVLLLSFLALSDHFLLDLGSKDLLKVARFFLIHSVHGISVAFFSCVLVLFR